MLPFLPRADLVNRHRADAVDTRDFSFRSLHCPNGNDIQFGKFSARPFCSFALPFSGDHIIAILPRRSEIEVIWVYARRIVACMKNVRPFVGMWRKRPVMEFEANSVRKVMPLSPNVEHPISLATSRFILPNPTAVWAVLVNAFPEHGFYHFRSDGFLGWHGPNMEHVAIQVKAI